MATHRLALLVSLIAAMTAACAGTGSSPPSTMTTTTLMSGWEQHFTVEWADQAQNGARRVTGHVYASKGDAEGVRLLAQALDASGTVISQRIAYVPGAWEAGAHTSRSRICRRPTRTESAFGTTPRSVAKRRTVDARRKWLWANARDEAGESHVTTEVLAKGTRLLQDRQRGGAPGVRFPGVSIRSAAS